MNEPDTPEPSPISVPELRDYHQINAEIVRRLNRGERRVRLDGVERQRLLATGLSGPWEATVELLGDAGPELAAGLDAPNLLVVCRGASADGAGSGLKAGRLVLHGATGTAVGYAQGGGLIVVLGPSGPRAGLRMSGGRLVLCGPTGRLAGEGQAGGELLLPPSGVGPHAGRGAFGGSQSTADASWPSRYSTC